MAKISDYLNFLHAKGIALSDTNPGSTEYALKLEDVFSAVDLLNTSNTAILGGDILSKKNGKLNYTYENWYCQQQDKEESDKFISRSHLITREYIYGLINNPNYKYHYAVLVI
jgi:hypothetical protein